MAVQRNRRWLDPLFFPQSWHESAIDCFIWSGDPFNSTSCPETEHITRSHPPMVALFSRCNITRKEDWSLAERMKVGCHSHHLPNPTSPYRFCTVGNFKPLATYVLPFLPFVPRCAARELFWKLGSIQLTLHPHHYQQDTSHDVVILSRLDSTHKQIAILFFSLFDADTCAPSATTIILRSYRFYCLKITTSHLLLT
jgi:hypothetical protein